MVYKDKIIPQWISNYNANVKYFNKDNVKPLSFLYRSKYYFNKPVVIVNSGPSLDKQISLLEQYKGKAVIISCDSCAFKLIKNGIDPDLIVVTDPSHVVQEFFIPIATSKYTLVCPTTASPYVVGSWKGNCFLYNPIDTQGTEKGDTLAKLILPTIGFGSLPNRATVTSTCCQVSSLLSPTVVMMIGLDLSFTLDKPYFTGLVENYLTNKPSRSKEEVLSILTKDAVQVEGDLYTTKLFEVYKVVLNYVITQELKLNCINCTEGGIFDCVPLSTFQSSLEKYCIDDIERVNLFVQPKKKRGRR